MKYLTGVVAAAAAFALMFAFSQDANAQFFRGRCGGGYPSYSYSYIPSYSYSYIPSYSYSYIPSYSYSYIPSYSYSTTGGYYFRGCNGRLYYVYPSQLQPFYVNPTPKKGPSFQDLPDTKKVPINEPKTAPKREAPGFQDLPAPKTGFYTTELIAGRPKTTGRPVITVPAPGFQDLPPKK